MHALEIIDHSAHAVATRPRADQSPALVYLARLAPGSRRTQAGAIRAIIAIVYPGADPFAFAWHRCEYQHAQLLRSELARTYKAATANRILAAFRGVLKECWRLGQMSAEQYQRAADVANIRGKTVPAGRALSDRELWALMRACDADDAAAGCRDAALIALLYSGGCRRSEAVGLNLADWTTETAALLVRGKGNKERVVFLAAGAAARLERYLNCRGRLAGPLFCRIYKGGRLTDLRLSDQAVRYILLERCKEAHIEDASPHDLRRSCISSLLDAGADISMVQQQAGHQSISTTQIYDRRGDEKRRKAMQVLHVP